MTLPPFPLVAVKTSWDVICGQVLWEVHAGAQWRLVVAVEVRGLPGGGGCGDDAAERVEGSAGKRHTGKRPIFLTGSVNVPKLTKKIQVHQTVLFEHLTLLYLHSDNESLLVIDFYQPSFISFFPLPDERDKVQKKTFTKWINQHLMKVSVYFFCIFELFCRF